MKKAENKILEGSSSILEKDGRSPKAPISLPPSCLSSMENNVNNSVCPVFKPRKGVIKGKEVYHSKNKALIGEINNDLYVNSKLEKELIGKIEAMPEGKEKNICKKYLSRMMWIPSKVYFEWITNKKSLNSSERQFTPISNALLKRILGFNSSFLRKKLLEFGIVECDYIRKYNVKSYGYRLAERFYEKRWVLTQNDTIRCPIVIRKNDEIVKKMEQSFESVTVDAVEAENILSKNKEKSQEWHDLTELSYEMIQRKEFNVKVDQKSGRVYTVFTNLAKEARAALRLDDEKMVELDVASCQPLLMASIYGNESPEERKKYVDLIESGLFYEFFSDTIKNQNRDSTKKCVYAFMFDRNGSIRNKMFYWKFRNEFPTLEKLIWNEKFYNKYNEFAIKLQTLEAKIVICNVAPQLIEKGIKFITIHDSFMVKERDVDTVKQILVDNFKKIVNIMPIIRVKTETCKNYNNSTKLSSENMQTLDSKSKKTVTLSAKDLALKSAQDRQVKENLRYIAEMNIRLQQSSCAQI